MIRFKFRLGQAVTFSVETRAGRYVPAAGLTRLTVLARHYVETLGGGSHLAYEVRQGADRRTYYEVELDAYPGEPPPAAAAARPVTVEGLLSHETGVLDCAG